MPQDIFLIFLFKFAISLLASGLVIYLSFLPLIPFLVTLLLFSVEHYCIWVLDNQNDVLPMLSLCNSARLALHGTQSIEECLLHRCCRLYFFKGNSLPLPRSIHYLFLCGFDPMIHLLTSEASSVQTTFTKPPLSGNTLPLVLNREH